MTPTLRLILSALMTALTFAATPIAHATAPVEFVFQLPLDPRPPFARDLWADVTLPSGTTQRLPVFFKGDGQFAVRARATEAGAYRLGGVSEVHRGDTLPVASRLVGSAEVVVSTIQTMPQIHVAAGAPPRLALPDGATYQPIGSNLAWARGGPPAPYYERALESFHDERLNWIRIWMAHWGRLNLDWVATEHGRSPAGGTLDLRVAESWDRIITAAEANGVYVQLVLQHHGQYSSAVNPNWNENPWNTANPDGFLAKAGDFFTSATARELTAQKYRYIVARWGYSPAILAWELFNEVHWVDAYRADKNEAAVAAWHGEMAAVLRASDPYHHLVTTSTENLRSPIYAAMDYFQPHLYPSNILAAVRNFDPVPLALDRPVFYGEVGDDHLDLTAEQKRSGVSIVPPVWAGIMGRGRYAAQAWLGWDLLEGNRLGELGAVARFLHATQLGTRDLEAFSAVVECAARVPLVVHAGQVWQHRASPVIEMPLDGRELPEFADIPRNLVFNPASRAQGFPGSVSLHLDLPREITVRARVTAVGRPGASLRITVDGTTAAEKALTNADSFPAELAATIPAGRHMLVVENAEGPDWVQLAQLDLGLDAPALAAVGKRGSGFITCWLWQREGIFSIADAKPLNGTLVLDDVPAGPWRIEWWDSLTGTPAPASTIEHRGGSLRLPTPSIVRHAAVVLTRE